MLVRSWHTMSVTGSGSRCAGTRETEVETMSALSRQEKSSGPKPNLGSSLTRCSKVSSNYQHHNVAVTSASTCRGKAGLTRGAILEREHGRDSEGPPRRGRVRLHYRTSSSHRRVSPAACLAWKRTTSATSSEASGCTGRRRFQWQPASSSSGYNSGRARGATRPCGRLTCCCAQDASHRSKEGHDSCLVVEEADDIRLAPLRRSTRL